MKRPSNHHSSSTHTGTHDSAEYTHGGSYEWPWESADPSWDVQRHVPQYQNQNPSAHRANGAQGCLRVLVSVSRVLPPSHRIALLDGFTEVQFGRDTTDSGIPKVRLKEMEVSKLHATIYWDESWNGWGIVDMGSKHGTFLRSVAGASAELLYNRGVRLSPPKAASIPRRLYHSDEITVGGTTFVVHIHEDGLPCQECSPTGGDEIPLFPTMKTKNPLNHGLPLNVSGLDMFHSVQKASQDSRGKLTVLRRTLLAKHNEDTGPNVSEQCYVDRSAARRALHPSSLPSEAPGVVQHKFEPTNVVRKEGQTSLPHEPKSWPEVPIPPSSIGHRLLMKQGWRPGQSLGLQGEGRIDPVDMRGSSGHDRAGLGLKTKSPQNEDGYGWNKYSRWDR